MNKKGSLTRKQQPSKTKTTKPPEILELKNILTKQKNSIQNFKSRLDHAEERISDLEDRTLEITQSVDLKGKKELKKSKESLQELQDTMKRNNIYIMGIPEEKENEKGIESILKAIIAKIISKREKHPDLRDPKDPKQVKTEEGYNKTHFK